VTPIRLERNIS